MDDHTAATAGAEGSATAGHLTQTGLLGQAPNGPPPSPS